MLIGLVITGILGGIAALLLFDVIGEARGSHEKLSDRYHE
jgi:gas vesicle protein